MSPDASIALIVGLALTPWAAFIIWASWKASLVLGAAIDGARVCPACSFETLEDGQEQCAKCERLRRLS